MERESLTRLASLAASQLEHAGTGGDGTALTALPRLASEIRRRLVDHKPVCDRTAVLGFAEFFRLPETSTYRDLEDEARSLSAEIDAVATSPGEPPRVAHLRDLCRRLSSVVAGYEIAS